jgi:hypothetical protein
VTKHGFPTPANMRSLAAALGIEVPDSVREPRDHLGLLRSWWLALDTEVVQLHRTEVVAGPGLVALEEAMAGTADPDHTLEVWTNIADIAVPDRPSWSRRKAGAQSWTSSSGRGDHGHWVSCTEPMAS